MSRLSPNKAVCLILNASLLGALFVAFLAVKISADSSRTVSMPTQQQPSMLQHGPGFSPMLGVQALTHEMAYESHAPQQEHHYHSHNHNHNHPGRSTQEQIEHDRLYHGKPGAEVRLLGRQTFSLVAGQSKTVTLELESDNTTDQLHVVIRPSTGLSVLSERREWHLDLNTRQNLSLPVQVLAVEDGTHHLHVFVTQSDRQGQVSTRALAGAFTLGVDQQAMHFSRSEQLHKPGQAYRSMPALETIY